MIGICPSPGNVVPGGDWGVPFCAACLVGKQLGTKMVRKKEFLKKKKKIYLCKGQKVSLPFEHSLTNMWHMRVITLEKVMEIKRRGVI